MPGFLDLISQRVLGGLEDPYSQDLQKNPEPYGDFLSMLFGQGGKPASSPSGNYGKFLEDVFGTKLSQAPRNLGQLAANIARPITQKPVQAAPAQVVPSPAPAQVVPVSTMAPQPPMSPGLPYGDIYQEVGQNAGIPPIVLQALGQIESGNNPLAVSPTREHLGIGQIHQSWFAPGEDPFDPGTNIAKMALVLQEKLRQAQADKPEAFWEDAVARYYGGTLEAPLSPPPGIPGPDTAGYVDLWRRAVQSLQGG